MKGGLVATAPFRCSRCGEPLYSANAVCPECGAFGGHERVGASTSPPPMPPVVPPPPAPDRMATPPISSAGERPAGSTSTPRRAVPRFAIPAPVRPPEPASGHEDTHGHFPAPPHRDDRTVPFAELGREHLVVSPVASAPTVRADRGRFHALPPEQEQEPADPAEDQDASPVSDLRADDLAELRARPKRFLTPVRGLAILVVLALAGVVAWFFTGRPQRTPTPLLMQEETTAASTGPEHTDGIRIGTVWTRVPVAVVDGSGGRVQATGPFRLRVDGTVYTLSGEAMPIIPIEPESRIEARAISGTVTLTLSPSAP